MQVVEQAVRRALPNNRSAVVMPFGSTVSGLGTRTSDLDIVVSLGGWHVECTYMKCECKKWMLAASEPLPPVGSVRGRGRQGVDHQIG